jgi:hypothetical protein
MPRMATFAARPLDEHALRAKGGHSRPSVAFALSSITTVPPASGRGAGKPLAFDATPGTPSAAAGRRRRMTESQLVDDETQVIQREYQAALATLAALEGVHVLLMRLGQPRVPNDELCAELGQLAPPFAFDGYSRLALPQLQLLMQRRKRAHRRQRPRGLSLGLLSAAAPLAALEASPERQRRARRDSAVAGGSFRRESATLSAAEEVAQMGATVRLPTPHEQLAERARGFGLVIDDETVEELLDRDMDVDEPAFVSPMFEDSVMRFSADSDDDDDDDEDDEEESEAGSDDWRHAFDDVSATFSGSLARQRRSVVTPTGGSPPQEALGDSPVQDGDDEEQALAVGHGRKAALTGDPAISLRHTAGVVSGAGPLILSDTYASRKGTSMASSSPGRAGWSAARLRSKLTSRLGGGARPRTALERVLRQHGARIEDHRRGDPRCTEMMDAYARQTLLKEHEAPHVHSDGDDDDSTGLNATATSLHRAGGWSAGAKGPAADEDGGAEALVVMRPSGAVAADSRVWANPSEGHAHDRAPQCVHRKAAHDKQLLADLRARAPAPRVNTGAYAVQLQHDAHKRQRRQRVGRIGDDAPRATSMMRKAFAEEQPLFDIGAGSHHKTADQVVRGIATAARDERAAAAAAAGSRRFDNSIALTPSAQTHPAQFRAVVVPFDSSATSPAHGSPASVARGAASDAAKHRRRARATELRLVILSDHLPPLRSAMAGGCGSLAELVQHVAELMFPLPHGAAVTDVYLAVDGVPGAFAPIVSVDDMPRDSRVKAMVSRPRRSAKR